MNKKIKYIKTITTIAIFAILFLQSFWIYNMYLAYENDLKREINKSLEVSTNMELSDRNNKMGGTLSFKMSSYTMEDYKRGYAIRKITTQDSTVQIKIDIRDPNADNKILQYLIKDDEKINIQLLDSIFMNELEKHHYQINASYIEYIDLSDGTVIENNKPSHWYYFSCSSDVIPLDIFQSIGVKAYISSQIPTFISQMILQLILSAILIVMACFCLFYLLDTIFTQRKIESLRQDMINAMTHEFKRPIANARGLLDLATIYLESGNREKVRLNIQKADFQLDRLAAYKQEILEINRNENQLQLNIKKIHIWDFIKTYPQTYRDVAEIFISMETSCEYFMADKVHFTNVMDNLVENAIKYSIGKAQITIRIYDKSSKLIFSVKDQGIGMTSPEKKHIFDKFYRANSNKITKKEGFGLGLTYSKVVINAHQGNITVDSTPNEGSTFDIEIPLKITE